MNIKRAVTVVLMLIAAAGIVGAGVAAVVPPTDAGVVHADTHWGTPTPQPGR